MFLKVGVKVLFIVMEIFLGFYSLVITESLLIKFLFFVFTAGIIAFAVLKTINKILPTDNALVNLDSENEE
ncbi:hypothetical protein [Christiangramia sp.]|uniref:hypothetical protein n=1 Tax=Christiangramia sp. TaxID=1931228 RepID=UPI002604BD8F|nr:hypothetical protein [Christiangramia sp.]